MLMKKCGVFIAFMGVFLCTACSSSASLSLEEALAEAESRDTAMEAIQTTEYGEENLFVYICGAVCEPGVYELETGSRIVQAVEAAGGFLSDAAKEAVNLAEPVTDGMQIIVPTMSDYLTSREEAQKASKGLVNINTAGVTELCTLNGIGQSKAEAIIAYRRELGIFNSIEQIKEVSGIGDSLFEQIKAYIYIE